MTLYDKDEMADLSFAEKRALKGSRSRTCAACRATPATKEVNYGSEEATGGPNEAQPLES